MSIYGNPVVLGGSGGGGSGVELIDEATWESMTTAQKQSHGLVAVQTANTGYLRGTLVYGQDYAPFNVVQTGRGAASASFSLSAAGSYYLLVIALNGEASTHDLTVSATLGGTALTGNSIAYNAYSSSGANRRNYRVMLYPITGSAGDAVEISLTDYTAYTGLVYAVLESPYLTIQQQLSTPDATTTGSYGTDGMVVYGGFAASSNGSVTLALYTADASVTAQALSNSYGSSYIFWFT